MRKNKMIGFTLIEMLLAMGFMAMILVAVAILGQKLTKDGQSEQAKKPVYAAQGASPGSQAEQIKAQAFEREKRRIEQAASAPINGAAQEAKAAQEAPKPALARNLSEQEKWAKKFKESQTDWAREAFEKEKARIEELAANQPPQEPLQEQPKDPEQERAAREEASRQEQAKALAEREAARDSRERELAQALERTSNEAISLKAQLERERQARAQAEQKRAQAFAELAQARAGLGVSQGGASSAPPSEQRGWLEWLAVGALLLASGGGGAALAGRLKSKASP